MMESKNEGAGAAPSVPAPVASKKMDIDEARDFLCTWMAANFPTDRTFSDYILHRLAGDFAWQLATALAAPVVSPEGDQQQAAGQLEIPEPGYSDSLADRIFNLPCRWKGDQAMHSAILMGHTMACEQAYDLAWADSYERAPTAPIDRDGAKLTKAEAGKLLELALDLEKTGRVCSLSDGQERTDFVAKNRAIQIELESMLRNLTEPFAVAALRSAAALATPDAIKATADTVVYVCAERDIECGNNVASWCSTCPKRPAIQAAAPILTAERVTQLWSDSWKSTRQEVGAGVGNMDAVALRQPHVFASAIEAEVRAALASVGQAPAPTKESK